MVAHVGTVAFLGLEARAVDVQVQISSGAAGFLTLGLPDKAVKESRERVQAALHAAGCEMGLTCPASQGGEAAWAGEVDVLAAPDLLSLLNHLKGTQLLSPPEHSLAELARTGPEMVEIKGQETAKRAVEIAAAGGHNLLS